VLLGILHERLAPTFSASSIREPLRARHMPQGANAQRFLEHDAASSDPAHSRELVFLGALNKGGQLMPTLLRSAKDKRDERLTHGSSNALVYKPDCESKKEKKNDS